MCGGVDTTVCCAARGQGGVTQSQCGVWDAPAFRGRAANLYSESRALRNGDIKKYPGEIPRSFLRNAPARHRGGDAQKRLFLPVQYM